MLCLTSSNNTQGPDTEGDPGPLPLAGSGWLGYHTHSGLQAEPAPQYGPVWFCFSLSVSLISHPCVQYTAVGESHTQSNGDLDGL